MFTSRIRAAGLALVAAIGLSGCGYNDGYGYSGVNVGYGAGYYDDGFFDDGYYGGGFGYGGLGYGGFANSYFGWNNGFYYPGTGYYVYGRDRRPVRWNDQQRRYWEGRRNGLSRNDRRDLRANWQGFRQERRSDDRAFRQDRRGDRQALRSGQVTRPEFRAERRDDRRTYRQDYRGDVRQLRRENRQDLHGNRGGAGARAFRGSGNRGVARRAARPR